jgi:hypothetical protein
MLAVLQDGRPMHPARAGIDHAEGGSCAGARGKIDSRRIRTRLRA